MNFCNLCQQLQPTQKLYRIQNYDVVQCKACRLVFVALGKDEVIDVKSLYSEEYFEGGVSDGYVQYSANEKILRLQAQRMLKQLLAYQGSGELLEIGCAYGFFLLEAQKYFKVQGVENSLFAASQAKNRGLDVKVGDLPAMSLPRSNYSAVCLFDCIEHLTDPFNYLQTINALLKKKGVVAITTGDIDSFYARASASNWRLMTPPQHMFFFSQATLTGMLEKSGFKILKVIYPWKLVPWSLILYQISPKLKDALGPLGRFSAGLYINLFDVMLVIAQKD